MSEMSLSQRLEKLDDDYEEFDESVEQCELCAYLSGREVCEFHKPILEKLDERRRILES